MSETITLKTTALCEACKQAGGKMVDFHGWLLPVQYDGILAEHKAVRESAGMFDVSHMGQLFVEGQKAWELQQHQKRPRRRNVFPHFNRRGYNH